MRLRPAQGGTTKCAPPAQVSARRTSGAPVLFRDGDPCPVGGCGRTLQANGMGQHFSSHSSAELLGEEITAFLTARGCARCKELGKKALSPIGNSCAHGHHGVHGHDARRIARRRRHLEGLLSRPDMPSVRRRGLHRRGLEGVAAADAGREGTQRSRVWRCRLRRRAAHVTLGTRRLEL